MYGDILVYIIHTECGRVKDNKRIGHSPSEDDPVHMYMYVYVHTCNPLHFPSQFFYITVQFRY